MAKLRVGVLVSGTGSLLQAMIDHQDDAYEVAVVVSDRPGVQAVERAEHASIPALVIDWTAYGKEQRPAFSSAVARALREHDVGLACSAGFMRILSPSFFAEVGIPYMNSHPALLPSFPGAHGVRDALEHGVKVTGATIIFADEGVDTGPIVVQEAVDVRQGDTEETLHERIKVVERRIYVAAIRLFAAGRLKVEGRRVHVVG
ncbi:MAG: phosphoribosylglycinamide formyltransferase [Actinomycetota bacterium]